MNPELSQFRRDRAIRLLIPLFVFSGATSLVYETLWERQLHLVFGTSQVAVSTVLAAFMTGLALGGFGGAKWADKVKRPILAYAVLEFAIGIYALIFPWLLDLAQPVYIAFYHAYSPSPEAFATFQFVLLGSMLLPPTFCMGMTLPLLARFATTDSHESGEKVGRLYGANTIGAVVGTGIAGFLLLPRLGLETATAITAAGNLLLCIGALILARTVGELPPAPTSKEDTQTATWRIGALPIIALLAGFSSLAYEVSWFRIMSLILGASAYAFSIMLFSFLLGLGLGGWKGGIWADRLYAEGGLKKVLIGLVKVEAGIAGITWAAMYGYGEMPWLFVLVFKAFGEHAVLLWVGKMLLAMLLMVPPAFLMGVAFPFLVRAAAGESLALGKPVGRLYGWNTMGAILGASLGGLVLLPNLGVRGTVMVAIAINMAAACIAYVRSQREPSPEGSTWLGVGKFAIVTAALMFFAAPWNALLMTAGTYKYVYQLDGASREGIYQQNVDPYELLYYAEGLTSVVTVAEHRETGDRWLANNGKIDASSKADMPTQVLVSHMPFFYRPESERVLMVGLAAGYSAGAITLHTRPTQIDVVEIEHTIVEASSFFNDWNQDPLSDPRVNMIINDARNQLNLAEDGTYDLIISEPSNPWLTGVSNLFTSEYFALGKTKLAPGGIWSQWIQIYGMDTGDLKSLLGTFSDTYDYVHLFSTISDADLVLVGSDSPLELNAAAFDKVIHANPALVRDLREIEIESGMDLVARYRMDKPMLQELAAGITRNTDDNMRVEYSAPLNLHTWTGDANVAMLDAAMGDNPRVPYEATENTIDDVRNLAASYGGIDLYIQAIKCLKKAQRMDGSVPGLMATAVGFGELADQFSGSDNSDADNGGPTEASLWTEALVVLKEIETIEPGREDVAVLYVRYQQRLVEAVEDPEDEDAG